jgi:hypothetical protein
MATWVLITTMVVSTHVTGPGSVVSASTSSTSTSREGFPTEEACRMEGEARKAAAQLRHPGAKFSYDCRRVG